MIVNDERINKFVVYEVLSIFNRPQSPLTCAIFLSYLHNSIALSDLKRIGNVGAGNMGTSMAMGFSEQGLDVYIIREH